MVTLYHVPLCPVFFQMDARMRPSFTVCTGLFVFVFMLVPPFCCGPKLARSLLLTGKEVRNGGTLPRREEMLIHCKASDTERGVSFAVSTEAHAAL